MKTLRASYQSHLDGGVTRLCYCLRIERTDGVVLGFTTADRDLTIAGVVYKSSPGFDKTAVRGQANDYGDFDLEGALTSEGISRDDIAAGLYDYATLYLFRTRWDDPGVDDEKLGKGYWGQAQLKNGKYSTTFVTLGSALKQQVGRTYLPTCDANLGDPRCKVDLGPFTVTGTVTSVTDRRQFIDSGRGEAAAYFTAGKLTWTSGANAGLSIEVTQFSAGGEFQLFRPMPYDIAAGDTFSVYAGCQKRFQEDCISKFNNAINFRGFPDIPGQDAVTKFGGQ